MQTVYRFLLADRSGNNIAELHRAGDRQITYTLNGMDTVSFTLPITERSARQLSDSNAEWMVKVYAKTPGETERIVFYGPVISTESNFGPGGTVAVNAASPFWYLTKRYAGKTAEGRQFPTPDVVYTGGCSRFNAVSELLTEANAEGNTGIAPVSSSFILSPYASEPLKFKNVGEWISEIGAGGILGGGFDWRLKYQERDGSGIFALFQMGTPTGSNFIDERLIGRPLGAACSFEMGAGTKNNLTEVRQQVTREGLANVVYHQPQYEGGEILLKDASGSISARGRHELVLTEDIQDTDVRNSLIDINVAVRQIPRRVLQVTPAHEDELGRVPRFMVDYDLGDKVVVRVVEWGDVVINDFVRIYGVTVEIGPEGTPTHTLTITPEE